MNTIDPHDNKLDAPAGQADTAEQGGSPASAAGVEIERPAAEQAASPPVGDGSGPVTASSFSANLGAAVQAAGAPESGDSPKAPDSAEAVGRAGQQDPAAPHAARPNPKWGRAVTGEYRAQAASAPQDRGYGNMTAPAGFTPGQGAWLWLPHGPDLMKPWWRRHPLLVGSVFVFLLIFMFTWGWRSGKDSFTSGPKLAIINVEGMILDEHAVVDWMEKVRLDSACKGALLRINSPGGAVGPSQEIFAAVKRLAAEKPVVASMGAVGASGGYYIALGADEIIAGPSTLTASIGVKMQIPNLEELMRTLGIAEKTLVTGNLKDAGSSWRGMTPAEEAYFRALIGDMFDEFIETVSRERELPLEKVRILADGRAMTGRQALEAELIDALGDMYEAKNRLRQRCGIQAGQRINWVEGPEKETSLLRNLMGAMLEEARQQSAGAAQPLFFY